MRIVIGKDASVNIGMSPNEDSLHIEVGEHRDTLEHVYLHPSKTVLITWLAGGLQLLIK